MRGRIKKWVIIRLFIFSTFIIISYLLVFIKMYIPGPLYTLSPYLWICTQRWNRAVSESDCLSPISRFCEAPGINVLCHSASLCQQNNIEMVSLHYLSVTYTSLYRKLQYCQPLHNISDDYRYYLLLNIWHFPMQVR